MSASPTSYNGPRSTKMTNQESLYIAAKSLCTNFWFVAPVEKTPRWLVDGIIMRKLLKGNCQVVFQQAPPRTRDPGTKYNTKKLINALNLIFFHLFKYYAIPYYKWQNNHQSRGEKTKKDWIDIPLCTRFPARRSPRNLVIGIVRVHAPSYSIISAPQN